MKTTVKVTLSRAHKVTERLSQLLQATRSELAQVTSRLVTHVDNVDDYNGFRKQADTLLQRQGMLIKKCESITTDLYGIRKAIARKNQEVGVSDLMIELNKCSEMRNIIQATINAGGASALVPMVKVSEAPEMSAADFRVSEYNMRRISITGLNVADMQVQEEKLEELKTLKNKILDDISDLNVNKVELELSAENAKACSLT